MMDLQIGQIVWTWSVDLEGELHIETRKIIAIRISGEINPYFEVIFDGDSNWEVINNGFDTYTEANSDYLQWKKNIEKLKDEQED